jgi:putative nucleotidyltransferase with HDIG domain
MLMAGLTYVEHALLCTDPQERGAVFRNDPHLRQLLPELYLLADVPQPPEHHPEGDAFTHTLLAVGLLPANADRRLAWGVLLHDIGKADTTQVIDGRIRAFGHDQHGARMAETLLERLGMEEAIASDVVWLVRHHMFALSWQVEEGGWLSRRQRRFLADPRIPLLLDLLEIDARAAGGRPVRLAQVAFYRRAQANIVPVDGKIT